jgi:hypothetical protein
MIYLQGTSAALIEIAKAEIGTIEETCQWIMPIVEHFTPSV